MKRTLAASVATLLACLALAPALAVPASASLPAPDSVRAGHNISVFANSDFVGVFGYREGERLTVDVYRGPHRIATAFGPAVATPEGFTPDILPGDRIVVTDGGGTDRILVDDIAFTSPPKEDLSTPDLWDVTVEGRASHADGTPIPLRKLVSEVRQDAPRYLAEPNKIERVGESGWKATYTYPYRIIKNREGLDASEQRQAILSGNHEMGFGHVAPLPAETQIAESGAAGGPALDCGNPASPHYAPKQANAITTGDDESVNLTSGDLTLGGTAMNDVSAVRVELSDFDPATPDVSVSTTDLSGDSGEKGWSVSFTREQLKSLSDGALTATGYYAVAGGETSGSPMSLRKDLVAPKLSATPGPKTADAPLAVALRVDGGEGIRYTTDGSLPGRFSKTYRGVPIRVERTATIRTSATDEAGNRADASFEYVIREPSAVSLNLSATSLTLGRSIILSGALKPAHPGKMVSLTIKRDGAAALETQRRLSTSSAYSFSFTPKRAGSYSVTARFAGDADHRADASLTRSFKVVR